MPKRKRRDSSSSDSEEPKKKKRKGSNKSKPAKGTGTRKILDIFKKRDCWLTSREIFSLGKNFFGDTQKVYNAVYRMTHLGYLEKRKGLGDIWEYRLKKGRKQKKRKRRVETPRTSTSEESENETSSPEEEYEPLRKGEAKWKIVEILEKSGRGMSCREIFDSKWNKYFGDINRTKGIVRSAFKLQLLRRENIDYDESNQSQFRYFLNRGRIRTYRIEEKEIEARLSREKEEKLNRDREAICRALRKESRPLSTNEIKKMCHQMKNLRNKLRRLCEEGLIKRRRRASIKLIGIAYEYFLDSDDEEESDQIIDPNDPNEEEEEEMTCCETICQILNSNRDWTSLSEIQSQTSSDFSSQLLQLKLATLLSLRVLESRSRNREPEFRISNSNEEEEEDVVIMDSSQRNIIPPPPPFHHHLSNEEVKLGRMKKISNSLFFAESETSTREKFLVRTICRNEKSSIRFLQNIRISKRISVIKKVVVQEYPNQSLIFYEFDSLSPNLESGEGIVKEKRRKIKDFLEEVCFGILSLSNYGILFLPDLKDILFCEEGVYRRKIRIRIFLNENNFRFGGLDGELDDLDCVEHCRVFFNVLLKMIGKNEIPKSDITSVKILCRMVVSCL